MRRLIASEDGHRTSYTTAWTDVDIVSQKTRQHERNDAISDRAMSRRVVVNWSQIVKNRILFRHDDTRGPISATLNHAIY